MGTSSAHRRLWKAMRWGREGPQVIRQCGLLRGSVGVSGRTLCPVFDFLRPRSSPSPHVLQMTPGFCSSAAPLWAPSGTCTRPCRTGRCGGVGSCLEAAPPLSPLGPPSVALLTTFQRRPTYTPPCALSHVPCSAPVPPLRRAPLPAVCVCICICMYMCACACAYPAPRAPSCGCAYNAPCASAYVCARQVNNPWCQNTAHSQQHGHAVNTNDPRLVAGHSRKAVLGPGSRDSSALWPNHNISRRLMEQEWGSQQVSGGCNDSCLPPVPPMVSVDVLSLGWRQWATILPALETAPQAWAPCGALGSSVERPYRRVLHLLLPLPTALPWQGVWAATTTFGEEAGVEASVVVCVPLRPLCPCHPEKNLKNAEERC